MQSADTTTRIGIWAEGKGNGREGEDLTRVRKESGMDVIAEEHRR